MGRLAQPLDCHQERDKRDPGMVMACKTVSSDEEPNVRPIPCTTIILEPCGSSGTLTHPLGSLFGDRLYASSGTVPDQGPGGVVPAWTLSLRKEMTMHRRQFSDARNKLDLNDRVQVRIVRKRLNVSNKQLANLVSTAGNSIAAVSKEASSRRRLTLPGSKIPPAEVIASVKEPEVAPEALS